MTTRTDRTPRLLLPFAELALTAMTVIACDPQADPDYSGEPLATLRGDVDADGNPDADVGVLWWQNGGLGSECPGPMVSCGGDVSAGLNGSEIDFECLDACDEEYVTCSTIEEAAAYEQCFLDCGADYASVEVDFELCVSAAVGERVPVRGEFPAMFSLDLFAPPPDAALLADDGGLLGAFGVVIAIDPDAEDVGFDETSEDIPASILGTAATQVLFYAATDIPADSTWGRYVGGALPAGYHLLETHTEVIDCSPDGMPGTCSEEDSWLELVPTDLDTPLTIVFASPHELDWPNF